MQLSPEVIMKPGWIGACLFLNIVLSGCGTGGHGVTPEQLTRLTLETTTQQQLQPHLGEPKEKTLVFEKGMTYEK